MTNKQCIEVAEKVWGWEKKSKYMPDPVYGPVGEDWAVDTRELKIQVNSWQGFGRTVEAMHSKGRCIYIEKWGIHVGFNCMDTMCMDKNHVNEKMIDDDLDFPDYLWEATHLAALEALKND